MRKLKIYLDTYGQLNVIGTCSKGFDAALVLVFSVLWFFAAPWLAWYFTLRPVTFFRFKQWLKE